MIKNPYFITLSIIASITIGSGFFYAQLTHNTNTPIRIISPIEAAHGVTLEPNVHHLFQCPVNNTFVLPIPQSSDPLLHVFFLLYEYSGTEPPFEGAFYATPTTLSVHPEIQGLNTMTHVLGGKTYYALTTVPLQLNCTSGLTPESLCGNGISEVGERCDDGNTTSGDGCNSYCFVELGYSCNISSSPTVCNPLVPDFQHTQSASSASHSSTSPDSQTDTSNAQEPSCGNDQCDIGETPAICPNDCAHTIPSCDIEGVSEAVSLSNSGDHSDIQELLSQWAESPYLNYPCVTYVLAHSTTAAIRAQVIPLLVCTDADYICRDTGYPLTYTLLYDSEPSHRQTAIDILFAQFPQYAADRQMIIDALSREQYVDITKEIILLLGYSGATDAFNALYERLTKETNVILIPLLIDTLFGSHERYPDDTSYWMKNYVPSVLEYIASNAQAEHRILALKNIREIPYIPEGLDTGILQFIPSEDNPSIRIESIHTLGQWIQSPHIASGIYDLYFTDPDVNVRNTAKQYIDFGTTGTSIDGCRDHRITKHEEYSIWEVINTIGLHQRYLSHNSVSCLVYALRNNIAGMELSIIESIQTIAGSSIDDVLIASAHSSNATLVRKAIDALLLRGGQNITHFFIEVLGDTETWYWGYRRSAVKKIAPLVSQSVVRTALHDTAQNDPRREVRDAASAAIGGLPPPAQNGTHSSSSSSYTSSTISSSSQSSSLSSSTSSAPLTPTDVSIGAVISAPVYYQDYFLQFGITVSNKGPSAAHNVTVTLKIPSNVHFNPLYSSPECYASSTHVTCFKSSLLYKQEQWKAFVGFDIPSSQCNGQTIPISISPTVSSSAPDTNLSNNSTTYSASPNCPIYGNSGPHCSNTETACVPNVEQMNCACGDTATTFTCPQDGCFLCPICTTSNGQPDMIISNAINNGITLENIQQQTEPTYALRVTGKNIGTKTAERIGIRTAVHLPIAYVKEKNALQGCRSYQENGSTIMDCIVSGNGTQNIYPGREVYIDPMITLPQEYLYKPLCSQGIDVEFSVYDPAGNELRTDNNTKNLHIPLYCKQGSSTSASSLSKSSPSTCSIQQVSCSTGKTFRCECPSGILYKTCPANGCGSCEDCF